jgi:hypothetical protein
MDANERLSAPTKVWNGEIMCEASAKSDAHICGLLLELLESHHFLLHRPLGDQPIDIHGPTLAQPMGAIDGLQVTEWVPVMVNEDDHVSARQVEANTANL